MKKRELLAIRKMRVGPSESPCRGRLQTATSCCSRTAVVVNVVAKKHGSTMSGESERDERK
jgi:hypothetical protein